MSHVEKINAAVTDLECLAVAAKELGGELVVGQQHHKWYGRYMGDSQLPTGFGPNDLGKCDHAIHINGQPGAYEIGVVKRRDGKPGFELLADFWQGGYGLEEKFGKGAQRLTQEYKVQVAMKDRRHAGYRVVRTVKEDGRVLLRCTK